MNILKNTAQVLLCLAIVLSAPSGFAADIDIYSRPVSDTPDPALNPNILVVIDNSSNWASASQHWPGGIKQGEAELKALRTVIGELSSTTNVGLMMFTPGSGSNHNGSYVRFAMRPMTTENKGAFIELIGYASGCTDGANSLNGTPNCILKNFNSSEKVSAAQTDYSGAMLDVFKYFGGYTWPTHAQDDVAGANINSSQFGTRRYAGNPDAKSDPIAYLLLDGRRAHDAYIDDNGTPNDYTDDFLVPALPSDDVNRTNYNSPLTSLNNCAKNYVIFIGNGFPSQDSPSTLLGPPSLLPTQGVGGDVTQLPLANLATTTTTSSVVLAMPGCGTYPGADATASRNACNAKAGGTFTVTVASPAVFSRTAHGFVAGDPVTLTTTGSLPNGLATLTTYYVIAAGLTANTFEVSLSAGGAAVNTSGSQSGTHTVSNLAARYPGYSAYNCTDNVSCSAGSTTTDIYPQGTSACGIYATRVACESALPARYPGYGSYSCTNEAACTSNSTNPTNPIDTTSCISDNLSNATNCSSYGNTNYPSYSSFSCTSVANCGSSGKQWRIDANTLITTGKNYTMNGITTTTVTSTSFSQYINATSTSIAATPNGTYSAPTSGNTNNFDEWTRFLYQTDVSPATGRQNISTFTIDVFKDQQDAKESSLLISAAQASGGKYFQASDENGIANALRKIVSEIQSVNSVFASSSLPVSVNTQGTYLNQVFMGMFRPDGTASPRWAGNIKQYKFKLFNGVLKLADKNGMDAISSTTGFVTPCANSFWSSDTGVYWNFGGSLALGDCLAQPSNFPVAGSSPVYSDAPDGQVVEKGGAAQRLRGVYSSGGTLVSSSTNYSVCTGAQTPSNASCRMLKTCATWDGTSTDTCTTLTGFDTLNASINATTLNLLDATKRDSLIWWIRGQDVDNENSNFDNTGLVPFTTEMRPSVHGGVIHSQPAVVDYGGTIGTIAFYGDDQGVFHAVNGNQADTDGVELWGFIAPESYRKLNRQRVNSPAISYPGVTGSPAPTPKDYFFDGSVGVYQNSGAVWIFPSMRRGGRAIYAFDVSTPTSPVLKWRKGCFTSDTTNNTVCSAGWSNIGQTWSTAHITYLRGYVDGGGNQKPVLIFGGGYDQCEDANSQTRCAVVSPATRKGANIWIVDADTGAILRTYPTKYSVPGDVALLKDGFGNVNYIYASDTGGNIYRINVGSYDGFTFTSWSNNTAATDIILASMSETNQARKFINGPAVVPSADYNTVLLGSGDREHPLVSDYACNDYATTPGIAVTNQFYMVMDKPTGYPSPTLTPSSLVDVTAGTTTSATAAGTTTITNDTGGVITSSTKGWRFNFGQCEQTVNEALTIAGVTYFGTNAPSPTTTTSCTANLGLARGYAVDYLTGNPKGNIRSAVYVGGGMPPSPVAGVVDVDGTKYPFCIGCIDPDAANPSALQGGKVTINPTGSRYRAYWYKEGD